MGRIAPVECAYLLNRAISACGMRKLIRSGVVKLSCSDVNDTHMKLVANALFAKKRTFVVNDATNKILCFLALDHAMLWVQVEATFMTDVILIAHVTSEREVAQSMVTLGSGRGRRVHGKKLVR